MVVVCVLGVGRLGGNIAGDLAFNGHTVRVWDSDKNSLDKLNERLAFERKRLRNDRIMLYPDFLVIYNFSLKKRSPIFITKTFLG
jgi:prephenate dehydrogenase